MAKKSSTWDNALLPFRSLVIAQGEVLYAYNLLQDSFFNLFILTANLERPHMPHAQMARFYDHALSMWHVSQSDRQQRRLALAAISSLPTTLDIEGGIARLQWALKQTDELVDYRNLIAHTPMKLSWTLENNRLFPPTPRIGSNSLTRINRERLRLIKDVRFWKALRNDLLNLNDYVDFVTRQIAWREYEKQNGAPIPGARRSWPHKPRLPCLRQKKKIDQAAKAASSPPAPPKRRKRRRPSGGKPLGQS